MIINILCEGQSEESFVKKILAPYLEPNGIYVQPIVLGGVSTISADKSKDPATMAIWIEKHIWEDLHRELACIKFFPYIQMHEYEALLLSDVDSFHYIGMKCSAIAALKKDIQRFPTPEHINNSEQTSPSKRILKAYPSY